jgi:RNA polymerase sigma-70 factor (ECF subfamily)
MLGSPAGAEDAVQETLLRAWRGSHRFEGRAQLGTWLTRIARNVCLDELGARRPPVAASLDEDPDLAAGAPDGPAGRPAAADPADVVVHAEQVRLACAVALALLPPRQRAALVLCAVLDLRASEAATVLGTSPAAVNSALQRARATLLAAQASPDAVDPALGAGGRALLVRYTEALTGGDVGALVALAREEGGAGAPAAVDLLAA